MSNVIRKAGGRPTTELVMVDRSCAYPISALFLGGALTLQVGPLLPWDLCCLSGPRRRAALDTLCDELSERPDVLIQARTVQRGKVPGPVFQPNDGPGVPA